ncbi:MAG: hypothetical protein R2824_18450 [Saprospiraceae bacterium]
MDPFWDQVHEGFEKAISQIGEQNVEIDLLNLIYSVPETSRKRSISFAMVSM